MEKVVKFLADILRFHKKKILVAFVSALLFSAILFPYKDLADLLTAQIAAQTQNQVFIQFDELGIALLPMPSIELINVELDTPALPTLHAESLQLAPSLASLLQFRQGFRVLARGLMNGDLSLRARTGDRVGDSGDQRFMNINLEYQNLDLKAAQKTFNLSINLEGAANMTVEAKVDPFFSVQPDGQGGFEIQGLRLPSSSIPTPMGAFTLPTLQFSGAKGKARLVGGELIIEELQLGEPSEPFSARVRGNLGLSIQRRGLTMAPQMSTYDLRVEINVQKSVESELALFLGFLSKFKSPTLKGSRYVFQAKGSSLSGGIPNLTPLTSF